MNQFYTNKHRSLDLLTIGEHDKIRELSLTRIAFVYPENSRNGGIYTVETAYSGVMSFSWCLNQCINDFLGDTAVTTHMWRLYIHGRHYGFVVPEGMEPVRRSIPFTSGGFYQDTEENRAVIFENVVYWDDMDQAFYRRQM